MNKKISEAVSEGKKRNYKKAVEILLEVIGSGDEDPRAYLYLGRSYYALGHYALSIQYLRMFLDLEPDSPIGHFFIARSFLVSGLVKNAVQHFKVSIRLHPESAHARGFLGLALMKLGRFETALKYLGEAVELSAENRKIFEIYLNCLFIVAIRKFNAGDFDIAKEMFLFYTGYKDDNVLPFIYLGMIERQSGNNSSALDFYEKAIALSPGDDLLLFRRALLLYKTGNRDLAIEELNRLDMEGYDFKADPSDMEEERFLALKYFQGGSYKDAVYFGREALKKDKSDVDMHIIMGEAYRKLGKHEYSKNHYQRAIELDRSRLEIRYGYILLLWQAEEYEEMLSELKKLYSMDPDRKIPEYYTALVYCKLDYPPETTIPLLQDQIRANPTDPFLFQFLGEQYLRSGLESLAEKWFLKAKSIKGVSYELLMDFINTYRATGEQKKLLSALKEYFDAGYFDYDLSKEYILNLYELKKYKEVIKEAERALGYSRNRKIERILANSYRLNGDYGKAVVLYRDLLKEKPDSPVFLKALVYCMEKNGEIEKSVKLMETALSYIKKPESSLYLIYGVLLYKNGDTEKASAVFRDNIARYPDDWRSYKNLSALYREQGLEEFAERYRSEAEKRRKK